MLTISVYGDDERAIWNECNNDAREQALYETLYTCPDCGYTKEPDNDTCICCMSDTDYNALLDSLLQVIA